MVKKSNKPQEKLDRKLFKAVKNQNKERVITLIKNGANPNTIDAEYGMNCLHYAAKRGLTSIFGQLLKASHIELGEVSTYYAKGFLSEATVLHYAAYHGHLDIVKSILKHEQGKTSLLLNLPDQDGCGALHYAIHQNKVEIVKVLIDQDNIDINLFTETDEDEGEIPNNCTPIMQAIIQNKPNIVALLLKQKKHAINWFLVDMLHDPDACFEYDNNYDYKYEKDFNDSDSDNSVSWKFDNDNNLLHLATALERTEIVKLLLPHVPTYVSDATDNPIPLDEAADTDNEEIIIAYIQSGKVEDLNAYLDSVNNILHLACKNGWLKVLDTLATIPTVDFNKKNKFDQNAYHLASIAENKYDVLAKLAQIQKQNPEIAIEYPVTRIKATRKKMRHEVAKRRKELLQELDIPLYIASSDDEKYIEATNPIIDAGLFSSPDQSEIDEMTGDELPIELSAKYASSPTTMSIILDDDSSNEEDLPLHVTAFKLDDEKLAKLAFSLPGANPDYPLPGMIHPTQYIRSEKMQKLYKKYKAKKYPDEITTTGSYSVPSIIEGRANQEAALIANHPIDDKYYFEEDIYSLEEKQLHVDSLNELFAEKKEIGTEEENRFVIAHFRGFNFNREIFRGKSKHEFLKNVSREGIHSKMSYYNAGIKLGMFLTEEHDELLNQFDNKVRALWSQALNKKVAMAKYWHKAKKRNPNDEHTKNQKPKFKKPKYLLQQRYTNVANKTFEKSKYIDIWEEMWPKVKEAQAQILEQCTPEEINIFDELELKGNPLTSFGKTPGHAVRYAVGRSLSGALRKSRGDPRYNNNGEAKHRLIGLVYVTFHTINQYLAAKPSDVTKLHKKGKISIHSNYLYETEVSFPGGVPKENIEVVIPIYFPTFQLFWDELDQKTQEHYLKWYGLNKDKYNHFAQGYKNTVRAEGKLSIAIFNYAWKEEYQDKYGLDATKFDLFKTLLHAIKTNDGSIAVTELKKLTKALKIKTQIKVDPNGKITNIHAMMNAIEKKLRDINPYRILKNELRDHFAGYNNGKKFVEGHLSQLILEEAKNRAMRQGKILIYRDCDKQFKLFEGLSKDIKNSIVSHAKQHDSSSIESDSEESDSEKEQSNNKNKKRKAEKMSSLLQGNGFFKVSNLKNKKKIKVGQNNSNNQHRAIDQHQEKNWVPPTPPNKEQDLKRKNNSLFKTNQQNGNEFIKQWQDNLPYPFDFKDDFEYKFK